MLDTLNLENILFLDIETVPNAANYSKLPASMKDLWNKKTATLKKSEEDTPETLYKRAGIYAEFGKIICISVGIVTKGKYAYNFRVKSFFGHDEKKLLKEVRTLLDRCEKLGFYLCGHNLKNFDIPMLAKRMIINGIRPSKILPSYDTKPWEIKAIDTKEIWQYGSYTSIGSLDLLCSCLNIPTPKDGEITGANVHSAYWEEQKIKEITEYCEKDVDVLIETIIKLKSLE